MPLTKRALYLLPSGRFYYLLRQGRRSSAVSEPTWGTLRGLFPRQFAGERGCRCVWPGGESRKAARAAPVTCAAVTQRELRKRQAGPVRVGVSSRDPLAPSACRCLRWVTPPAGATQGSSLTLARVALSFLVNSRL